MISDHLYIGAIDAGCWTDISVGAPGYHTHRCGWLSQNGCLSAAPRLLQPEAANAAVAERSCMMDTP